MEHEDTGRRGKTGSEFVFKWLKKKLMPSSFQLIVQLNETPSSLAQPQGFKYLVVPQGAFGGVKELW